MKKTKLMKVRKGGNVSKSDKLFLKGLEIEYVNSFKYLGIVFSAYSKPNCHIKHLTERGIKVTNILNAKVAFSKLNFTSAMRLFEAVILPSTLLKHLHNGAI